MNCFISPQVQRPSPTPSGAADPQTVSPINLLPVYLVSKITTLCSPLVHGLIWKVLKDHPDCESSSAYLFRNALSKNCIEEFVIGVLACLINQCLF